MLKNTNYGIIMIKRKYATIILRNYRHVGLFYSAFYVICKKMKKCGVN